MADLREHPDVVRFLQAARSYCGLAESVHPDKETWLRNVLAALSLLYAAALHLPEIEVEEFDPIPDDLDVTREEWHAMYNALGCALGGTRCYWAYFDPSEPLDAETKPIMGDLADDLADIYGDVKPGLRAWDTGVERYTERIVWDWKNVLFESHWGIHATDALRMLHHLVFLRGLT